MVVTENWRFVRREARWNGNHRYFYESENYKFEFSINYVTFPTRRIILDRKDGESVILRDEDAEEFRLQFLSQFPELLL